MSTTVDADEATFEMYGGGSAGIRLDSRSGEPVALLDRGDPRAAIPLVVRLAPVWGGEEVAGVVGGLEYPGAERRELSNLRMVGSRRSDCGDTASLTVTARDDDWEVEFHYRLPDRPSLTTVGVTLRRAPGAAAVQLRNLELVFEVAVEDPSGCVLNAPGNQMRGDVPLTAITAPLRVFGPAAMHGGPSIVAVTDPGPRHTAVIWPLSQTEVGAGELTAGSSVATFTFVTDLAGNVDEATGLRWDGVRLAVRPGGWTDVRPQLGAWYQQLGLGGPVDRPAWIESAHIYEAHVGFSVFAGGYRYQRYETVRALHDDLPRLQALGFDVIQLMPRHPYPSYNVHDYHDIDTTYGDEAELRSLVDDCHARGMRVLLDIIIHGVIDQEVMDATLASVQTGPYADRLDDGTLDYLADSREDIAWARHIVEYAPYWRDGSVRRHPLADEHPDWFMRSSGGEITRRYTKAFDIANPSWQRHFIDACLDLTARLGTDGFRVDAPTYNSFATWAQGRPWRASYGPMAAVPLLRDLQARLRAAKPDATVYTEPGGALFRATADMTYNYDEHWLVESLLAQPDHPQRDWRMVRDGRELGRWLGDRDESHPPGAGIVHHVDSHDSIWWRLPGAQWRRERFGREATIALVALFGLAMRGAYMTFMGGEGEIEVELLRAHTLRRTFPELASGACAYLPDAVASDALLCVERRLGAHASMVVINLAPEPLRCRIALTDGSSTAYDHWNEEPLQVEAGSVEVTFGPYQPRVLRL